MNETTTKTFDTLCVKSVRVRSFSDPIFPAFGLNTKRYSVSLRIQSKCGKIRTRNTPNTDTFHSVIFIRRFPALIKSEKGIKIKLR